jgi:hypothetical protein
VLACSGSVLSDRTSWPVFGGYLTIDRPSHLAFSDEATFTFFRLEIQLFIFLIVSGFCVVLGTSDLTLADMELQVIVFGGLCLVWVGVFVSIAWGHRFRETQAINRLFAGEIWACWKFSTLAWKSQVETVCNQISPQDEGKEAYSGVIASAIFGAVFAIIMSIIVFFAVKDPLMRKTLWITSGVVFLLFVGAGLFQPMAARYKADRYRRKAMKYTGPRVWFGPDGIYHEALGHTSLKELHKVTDQTKSRKAIQFTLVVSSDTYNDLVKIRLPVPSGCEEQASRLVHRYREERLLSKSN